HPIALTQRLPELAIPLSPGDPDVPLDFQTVFDQSYDFGPYRREIEYGKDPVVPRLNPEQAEWAASVLKPGKRRRGLAGRPRRSGQPDSAGWDLLRPIGVLQAQGSELRQIALPVNREGRLHDRLVDVDAQGERADPRMVRLAIDQGQEIFPHVLGAR